MLVELVPVEARFNVPEPVGDKAVPADGARAPPLNRDVTCHPELVYEAESPLEA